MPRVAVVLVHYGSEEETAACIRSVRDSDYEPFDIILVDNGIDEEVGDRLSAAYPDVHLIHAGANLGFTGGYNRGIARALEWGCDYVLVLNNDTLIEPDCLSELVRAAESQVRVGAVGGTIYHYDQPDRVWFGGGRLSIVRGLGEHRRERPAGNQQSAIEAVTFLTGCCMLLSAEALREVGGFEEDFFMYVEDVDLSVRLLKAGYSLLYTPAASLYHRVPVSEAATPPHKIVLRDRNRRRMARRRFGRLDRLKFGTFFYSTRLLHAIVYVARGDLARLRALWEGMVAR